MTSERFNMVALAWSVCRGWPKWPKITSLDCSAESDANDGGLTVHLLVGVARPHVGAVLSPALRSSTVRAFLLKRTLPRLIRWPAFRTGPWRLPKLGALVHVFERTFNAQMRIFRRRGYELIWSQLTETNEHVFDTGRHSALWMNE